MANSSNSASMSGLLGSRPHQLVSEPSISWNHGGRQGDPLESPPQPPTQPTWNYQPWPYSPPQTHQQQYAHTPPPLPPQPPPPPISSWSSQLGFPEDPRDRIMEESLGGSGSGSSEGRRVPAVDERISFLEGIMLDLNSKFELFMEEMSRSRRDHEVSNHNLSQTTPLHYSTATPISPPPPPDLCGTYYTPSYSYHASMPVDPFFPYSTMMQIFSSTQMHQQPQQYYCAPCLFDKITVQNQLQQSWRQHHGDHDPQQPYVSSLHRVSSLLSQEHAPQQLAKPTTESEKTLHQLEDPDQVQQHGDPGPHQQNALQIASPHSQVPEPVQPPQKKQQNVPVKKLGSMSWCRRCDIDCTDMEGLVLHSLTSEHQNQTMTLVMHLKQSVIMASAAEVVTGRCLQPETDIFVLNEKVNTQYLSAPPSKRAMEPITMGLPLEKDESVHKLPSFSSIFSVDQRSEQYSQTDKKGGTIKRCPELDAAFLLDDLADAFPSIGLDNAALKSGNFDDTFINPGRSVATTRSRGHKLMVWDPETWLQSISSACPVCHISLPFSELEWHANIHFMNKELARGMELAQEIALASQSHSATDYSTVKLHSFYESLQPLKLQVPSMHAVVVGSDVNVQTKFETELRDYVASQGLQDCVHVVNKTLATVPYLAANDVLVQNSQASGECFGRITIEERAVMVWDPGIEARLSNAQAMIKASVGGAYKIADVFKKKLGVSLDKLDEIDNVVDGANFLLKKIPGKPLTYMDVETVRVNINQEKLFPYLLVNIRSGVSMIKVTGNTKYERVTWTHIFGLAKLLTGCSRYDKFLKLNQQGDNLVLDLIVKDICGELVCEKQVLSASTLVSSFGKVITSKRLLSVYKPEDLAAILLRAFTYNITQVSFLVASLLKLKQVYFGRSYKHGHASTRDILYAINYRSKGQMQAVFLRHEGFLGALSASINYRCVDDLVLEDLKEQEPSHEASTPVHGKLMVDLNEGHLMKLLHLK